MSEWTKSESGILVPVEVEPEQTPPIEVQKQPNSELLIDERRIELRDKVRKHLGAVAGAVSNDWRFDREHTDKRMSAIRKLAMELLGEELEFETLC